MTDITLDFEDIQILKEVERLERAASFTAGVLTLAPLAGLFTTNPTSFTFAFFSADWEGHAGAVNDVERIKACRIAGVVGAHLFDLHGDKEAFFKVIYKTYDDICQK